jgi:hypothetical protein
LAASGNVNLLHGGALGVKASVGACLESRIIAAMLQPARR